MQGYLSICNASEDNTAQHHTWVFVELGECGVIRSRVEWSAVECEWSAMEWSGVDLCLCLCAVRVVAVFVR